MDIRHQTENTQSHLNFLEVLYQKIHNRCACFFFCSTFLKKSIYLKNSIFHYNVKKNLKNLNEYLKKIWYFSFSFICLYSWFFLWIVNSFDLILSKNTQLNNTNLNKILKLEFFFSVNTRHTSTNLLSLYTETIIFININKNNFKLHKTTQKHAYSFLKKIKKNTSFRSCGTGEFDSRLNYCSLMICSLYNILTSEISADFQWYIRSIQGDEGSFGGSNKFKEEHLSFFYCCISSMILFSKKNRKKVIPNCFKYWISQKKKLFDFSVQGRSSKLTDCCYVFWLNSVLLLGCMYLSEESINNLTFFKNNILFGFSDKIGRRLDLYHTYYAVCSFSILNFKYRKYNQLTPFCSLFEDKMKNVFICKINPVYGIGESTLMFWLSS